VAHQRTQAFPFGVCRETLRQPSEPMMAGECEDGESSS
jgi:hypothetical protein